ncbi:glycoside hydrolase family 28 protein [Sphingomonas sp. AP4-R1]|uniref:rhamnogalacturonidase n=1 Tax=Sphingomonas sp. AP4-R1 TaxID=2735134 RepID=UPI0020A4B337|nr:glycoside hydrolase family 28 protein [Sphingomonas sp. AP4-R1]
MLRRRSMLALSGSGLLMAGASAAAAADPRPGHSGKSPIFYNVRDYGARGDGKAVDTPAINQAIDACADAGGGTVFIPAGDYLCFTIRLRSHVNIHLSQGCRIIAADSPKPGETNGYMGGRYDLAEPQDPAIEPFQDYGHNHWRNSLFWGEGLQDLSITGPGLIWGRGLSHGRGDVKSMGNRFTAAQPGVGNKAIALKNCRNVAFSDFSILKGGHFGLLLTGVDNLTIDNLTIDTDRDGMDIDCCRNVRVSNCFVNSPWDDGICPKSSFALGYARATENVTITNCYVSGCWELGTMLDGSFKRNLDPSYSFRTGRIKLGTESNGGFKNIAISNCVFEGCGGLALETVDGALLEDVAISNVTMRDISNCPIFIRLGARMRGPAGAQVGALRRVSINNLVSHNSESELCALISGIPGHAIEDLHMSNIFLDHRGGARATQIRVPELETMYPDPERFGPMPAHGFFVRHVRNLEMNHIEVRPSAPDARPAFYLEDVSRADFFAITAPRKPAFELRDVTDFRLGWSRIAEDAVIKSVAQQVIG